MLAHRNLSWPNDKRIMQEARKDVLDSQAIRKTGAVTPRYGRKTMALLIWKLKELKNLFSH